MDDTRPRKAQRPSGPSPARACTPLVCRPVGRPARAPAPGAEAYGFRGQVWTRVRVAAVMHLECDVWYHPAHVSCPLKAIR